MNDNNVNDGMAGWIFYDGSCNVCVTTVRRVDALFETRGFRFVPLQERWVAEFLSFPQGSIPNEFVVVTVDGRRFGGARAIVHLAARIWWAKPMATVLRLPIVFPILERTYRWFAARRYCISGVCNLSPK